MDKVCKICFKDIKDESIFNLVHRNNILCEDCFCKLKVKFHKFNISNIKGTAIYDYDEVIKELLYKFKGCYDYELKDVFLYRYLSYFKLIYHNYYLIPAPSYYIDDQKRGFNHVIEIFKPLNLKVLPIIKKLKKHKQSDLSKSDRSSVNSVLSIDENVDLKGKRILLVDDILTTGSTLFSCVELIRKLKPKRLEILVIAKTKTKLKTEY